MTQEEFEQYRKTWIKEWAEQWRPLDIDFESYMLMKGMSPDEYKKMNEESWKVDKKDLES
jgi:hypothetical protein